MTVEPVNRAERRRQHRQAPVINREKALADAVIWAGPGMDAAEAVRSLPPAVEAEVCTVKDGPAYKARNRAAIRGSAPFIIFMDADCTLLDGQTLIYAFEALSQGASVVGGLILAPGDMVMAAGYAFNVRGRPFFRFARWSAGAEKVQRRRDDLNAVPVQFMVTRRDVFRTIRFREEYGAMAYGDAHYCLQAKAKGPVVYEPRIQVQCEGGLLERPSEAGAMMLRTAGVMYDELSLLR